MAKLYFRHGTMGSAKTLNLLAVAHNYRSQNKKVLILKPRTDTRYGVSTVESRAGLRAEADLVVDRETVLDPKDFVGVDCVLVDEAQFLTAGLVDQLRGLTLAPGLPVICYGLRTDFQTHLFEGSRVSSSSPTASKRSRSPASTATRRRSSTCASSPARP
jgi:thymidine kinase